MGREIVLVDPEQAEVPADWLAEACPIEGMLTTLFADAVIATVELTAPDNGLLKTSCGVMI